jgi:hypothetical protein
MQQDALLSHNMQPDFSALFRREKVAPLHFRVRPGACAVHDIHFLSSYLHDARIRPDAIKRRGGKLTIDLERDCWELGSTEHPRSCELHVAKSRLSVTPVSSVRWETTDILASDRELWIESIYLGAAHWEAAKASELVLSAPNGGWKLIISVARQFGNIRLDDKEVPHLYSSRKTKQGRRIKEGSAKEAQGAKGVAF